MESGPDAIFGRVEGRKLPNKLDARLDAEPVCAMDGASHFQLVHTMTSFLNGLHTHLAHLEELRPVSKDCGREGLPRP